MMRGKAAQIRVGLASVPLAALHALDCTAAPLQGLLHVLSRRSCVAETGVHRGAVRQDQCDRVRDRQRLRLVAVVFLVSPVVLCLVVTACHREHSMRHALADPGDAGGRSARVAIDTTTATAASRERSAVLGPDRQPAAAAGAQLDNEHASARVVFRFRLLIFDFCVVLTQKRRDAAWFCDTDAGQSCVTVAPRLTDPGWLTASAVGRRTRTRPAAGQRRWGAHDRLGGNVSDPKKGRVPRSAPLRLTPPQDGCRAAAEPLARR